jgi:hypothetical protein
MEFAIPIVGLGALYVISNQNQNKEGFPQDKRGLKKGNNLKLKPKSKEHFTNMGMTNNYLPNTNIPPQNYPVPNKNELADNVQNYPNPNVATDKYFNQNAFERRDGSGVNTGNSIQNVYSLTGNYMDTSEFKHNNMTPFYGGKIKGQVYGMNNAETILDNMNGSGSQVIKKVEQAPLFKPQENMQWANGAPNMSDFFQSRVNPSMRNSNIKPFESEYVGPGLNKGYTTEGSGGFNSGMEARNLWTDKNVDELRVATNPKLEYSLQGHQGPAGSYIKTTGSIGKVEKYHPDTFFIQTQDRWLTTTGAEKGETLRPTEIDRFTTRSATSQSYNGVASAAEKTSSYVPNEYEKPKRPELPVYDVAASSAAGRGPNNTTAIQQSHTNYVNNRSTMREPDTFRSGFSGAIGAVVAPLMDFFKPTRKEEVMSNIRIYGDAGSKVASGYVNNPNDVAPTTIKETTLYAPNTYIGNQKDGAYMVSEQQSVANQRDTTNVSAYGGAGGSASRTGAMNYDAAYIQTNNEYKEKLVVNRPNQGNTQIYNAQMNVNVSRIDGDRNNTRMWVPTNMPQMAMTKEVYGQMRQPQTYDQSINTERISPDLLTAFRENPFTHSLNSAV